jgi:hypothetical protein
MHSQKKNTRLLSVRRPKISPLEDKADAAETSLNTSRESLILCVNSNGFYNA